MMIRYKVVNLNRRSCCAKDKYQLSYNKDDIVKADIKTHGIMTFKDYKSAYHFKNTNDFFGNCAYILEVQPFGRAKKVRNICTQMTGSGLDSYYKHKKVNIINPPSGTLCYHAVEVLT